MAQILKLLSRVMLVRLKSQTWFRVDWAGPVDCGPAGRRRRSKVRRSVPARVHPAARERLCCKVKTASSLAHRTSARLPGSRRPTCPSARQQVLRPQGLLLQRVVSRKVPSSVGWWVRSRRTAGAWGRTLGGAGSSLCTVWLSHASVKAT